MNKITFVDYTTEIQLWYFHENVNDSEFPDH